MIWSKKQEAALFWILVRSNPMKDIESILPLPKTAGQQSYFLYFKLSEASKKVTKAQNQTFIVQSTLFYSFILNSGQCKKNHKISNYK